MQPCGVFEELKREETRNNSTRSSHYLSKWCWSSETTKSAIHVPSCYEQFFEVARRLFELQIVLQVQLRSDVVADDFIIKDAE